MSDKPLKSIDFFSKVLENINQSIVVLNLEKKILYSNLFFKDKFHSKQFNPVSIEDIVDFSIDEEERLLFYYYFDQAVNGEQLFFEWKMKLEESSKNSSFIKVNFNQIQVENVLYILVSMMDITSQKKTQTSLMINQARFQSIFESMIDSYIRLEEGGNIINLSPSIFLISGYEPYEIENEDLSMLFANKIDGENLLKKTDTYGLSEDFEAEFIKKDGHRVIVSINLTVAYDKDEMPIGYEGFIRDISARKEIENELRSSREELKNANIRLEKISRIDPLTQLFNRRDMLDRMNCEKKRFERNDRVFSILLMDIDKFKNVNDSYGHDTGDYILVEVSKLIVKTLRQQDHAARWGGEEFLILLPETKTAEARLAAERIRSRIGNHTFEFKGQKLRITLTIGIDTFDIVTNKIDVSIKNADIALYQGKNSGRNKVVVFKRAQ